MASEMGAEGRAPPLSATATSKGLALTDLLTRTGAKIRGHGRADCPQCGRLRAVSYDESKGVYHCHGAGCTFSGGIAALRRQLGLQREWLPHAEYLRQKRERERVREAAERLAAAVHARRMELLDWLHGLNRLEALAHNAGASEQSWEILAEVYSKRPGILAELLILENYSAADLLRYYFTADDETREQIIAGVIAGGGLWEKRRMDCWHCVTAVVFKDRTPGRCIQSAWPGGCWRGCRGTCLVCGGDGKVLSDVLIEVAA